MRINARTFPPAEVEPESLLAPIDFASVFGRAAPLEIDLGCGDGAFLTARARQFPERNFLGVERLVGRVRSACRKIGVQHLPNARIFHGEILHAVQQLVGPASVDVFHFLFPDPWPKRRHHTRRTFTPSFLRAVARALKADGELRVATDDSDYFAAMQRVASEVPALIWTSSPETAALPQTTFEARFRQAGAPIHRLVLRKVSSLAR